MTASGNDPHHSLLLQGILLQGGLRRDCPLLLFPERTGETPNAVDVRLLRLLQFLPFFHIDAQPAVRQPHAVAQLGMTHRVVFPVHRYDADLFRIDMEDSFPVEP